MDTLDVVTAYRCCDTLVTSSPPVALATPELHTWCPVPHTERSRNG